MAELQQRPQEQPPSHQVAKAVGAATAGGSMLLLSGLTLAGTVVGLTLVTPLVVIFSPVLVPAGITVFLITLGFLSSGGLGLAAISVLSWIFRYVTGKQPPGSERLEQARAKLAGKARDVKERVEQRIEQAQHHTMSFYEILIWSSCQKHNMAWGKT